MWSLCERQKGLLLTIILACEVPYMTFTGLLLSHPTVGAPTRPNDRLAITHRWHSFLHLKEQFLEAGINEVWYGKIREIRRGKAQVGQKLKNKHYGGRPR